MSSCWTSKEGESPPFTPLKGKRFCKLQICYIISSLRSINDNKAFFSLIIVCNNCRSRRLWLFLAINWLEPSHNCCINKQFCTWKLKWSIIYHWRRQPYFFLANLYLNRVLARCMSWLISFAWANSSWKERKQRITKWKIIAHSRTRTHNPWITSLVP